VYSIRAIVDKLVRIAAEPEFSRCHPELSQKIRSSDSYCSEVSIEPGGTGHVSIMQTLFTSIMLMCFPSQTLRSQAGKYIAG